MGDINMTLEFLSRWSPPGFLSESPAEERLAEILEDGPGSGTRASFATARDWLTALESVANDSSALARCNMIIFPQAGVGRYRVDFLVVTAPLRTHRMGFACDAFFVECDGLIGHAENADQAQSDHDRELEIRCATGLDVLRFSGAEVLYRSSDVAAVIGAQVEAMAALRTHRSSTVEYAATKVLFTVASLSAHRARRIDYTARNSFRSKFEPYNPSDPFGLDGVSVGIKREAEWDPFLALRLEITKLRHADAHARQVAPAQDDEAVGGGLEPLGSVLLAVLKGMNGRINRLG